MGVGTTTAIILTVLGLVGLTGVIALSTQMSLIPLGVAIVVIAIIALVGLRWPLVALAVFVAMIPIEQVIIIDGFGTLSRLAGILFALAYGLPRITRLSPGLIIPAGWGFLAWSVASLGWAIDPDTAWAELQTLLQLFLIAFLIADLVAHRPSAVRAILWVYSLSAAATAAVGTLLFVASGPSADIRAAALQDQNPAQFAGVLLPALIFGLYEFLDGRWRITGAAIALVTSTAVIVSGTRGAWLAVVVVVGVFIFPRLANRQRLAMIATALVIGVVSLQIPGVANLISDRAATAISTGGAGRTDIWTVGVTIYESAPVLGVGYANFPVAYTGSAVRASDVSTGHGVNRAPHNLALATLTELGPLGLLLLAAFLLPYVLRPGWGPDAAVVQAGLASIIVYTLFIDIFGNRKQVWLLIGLAAGLAYVRRMRSKGLPESIDVDPAQATVQLDPGVLHPAGIVTEPDGGG